MNLLRRHLAAALGLSVLMCLVAPVTAAAAEQRAEVTVHVVLASKKPGQTDPRLARFKKQFSDFAYQSYQLLAVRQASIKEGATESVDLAGGKQLQLNFRSVGKDGRARMKLSIPGVVETTVVLGEGGDVVLGGPAMPHDDGVLFVPVTLNRLK